jgi:hypothetical protein
MAATMERAMTLGDTHTRIEVADRVAFPAVSENIDEIINGVAIVERPIASRGQSLAAESATAPTMDNAHATHERLMSDAVIESNPK